MFGLGKADCSVSQGSAAFLTAAELVPLHCMPATLSCGCRLTWQLWVMRAVLERLQGNLIRTPEGKICILDYGLMTEVTPEQSIALVEYISHLSVEDWDAVAVDLRRLGFIPPGGPGGASVCETLECSGCTDA